MDKSSGRGHTQRALSPVRTGRFPLKIKKPSIEKRKIRATQISY